MPNNINAEFLKSAVTPADFLDTELPTVIFAGRSNVGKSSLINAMLGRKNLARVGAAPGKTTQVNYFRVKFGAEKSLIFTDLPGYGYAQRSFAERDRWAALIDRYFASVGGKNVFGILITDSRREPEKSDIAMAEYFLGAGIPFAVAANKADKLKKSELTQRIEEARSAFTGKAAAAVLCSAENRAGTEELWKIIEEATAI